MDAEDGAGWIPMRVVGTARGLRRSKPWRWLIGGGTGDRASPQDRGGWELGRCHTAELGADEHEGRDLKLTNTKEEARS
jgi:hypothetical protein